MALPLVPLLIDGVHGPGATGATLPVVEPATDEAIATLAHAASADLDGALARAAALPDAGVVGVPHTAVLKAETPFVGVDESGHGAESGIGELDACLRTKMPTERNL